MLAYFFRQSGESDSSNPSQNGRRLLSPPPRAAASSSHLFPAALTPQLLLLPASDDAGLGFVKKERSSNSELIRDYPGHESLWCYRRFVCQAFLVIAPLEALVATSRKSGGEGDDVVEGGRSSELKTAGGNSAGAKASANVGCDPRATGDGYDWSGWNRAATEWYDRCVREDAEAQGSSEDEDEDQDDTLVFGETAGKCGSDHGDTREALPGTPSHGGMLAEFLGQEAHFALRCAADKVGGNERRLGARRELALAVLAYAVSIVVCGVSHSCWRNTLSRVIQPCPFSWRTHGRSRTRGKRVLYPMH